MSHVHPDDRGYYQDVFRTILKHGEGEKTIYRFVRPDNKQVIYLQAKGRLVEGNDNVTRWIGSVQDITDRILVQHELEQGEASLKQAQKIAKLGSWEWNVDADTVEWSDEMYNIYEREKPNVTIADVREYIHPEDRKRVRLLAENDLDDNINRTIEYRILLPSGKVKHVISVAEQVHDDKGEVIKLVGTLQDVTEQVNKEEQIRTLSLVASETVNGVLIHDPSGFVVWANKGFTNITGYTADEIVGHEPWSILSDENTDVELVKKTYEALSEGEPFSSDNLLRHKDGHSVWVHTTFTPVKDEAGTVTKVVSIGTDITKQKEMELLQQEALNQLEKDNEELKKRAKR